ncbi:hypothetical protein MSP8886_00537 [Marinomonas spartinae]|uniref:Immunity MXAN-0049 protein domain-containing protein n=1 Tax=Marinomonas spartinae TaxID=1792290 RepID=A0A1A8T434_9GAMM|nr:DUF1629 domain-containing protein [Marinomonas spartinae]SBS26219.1 hypothetical protein MSP8886_00537 [Marinomonas spartinae]
MSNFNKVFRFYINPDLYFYLNETEFEQTLQLTEGQVLLFDGHSMKDNWRTLGVKWLIHKDNENKGLEIPDIAGLGATSFVLSEKAKNILEPHLGKNVEYLECDLQGDIWYALNLVGFEDVLDKDLTQWNYNERGKVDRVKKFNRLVIDKKKIQNPTIFRAKEIGLRYMTTDAENSLYDLVKKHQLTGLDFREIETS